MMATIEKNNGLLYSEIIFQSLKLRSYELNNNIFVESFDNCREQGYVFTVHGKVAKHIAVCEHRNTDMIRIFVYSKCRFPSNLFENDSVEQDKCFSISKINDAVDFIINQVNDANSVESEVGDE